MKKLIVVFCIASILGSCNKENDIPLRKDAWSVISVKSDYNLKKINMISEKVGFISAYVDHNIEDGDKIVFNFPGSFPSDPKYLNLDGTDYLQGKWEVVNRLPTKPYIFKTVDGGMNWQPLNLPFTNLYDFSFINEEIGFTLSEDGIYRTLDGGLSWKKVASNKVIYDNQLRMRAFQNMKFVNHNEGFLYNNHFMSSIKILAYFNIENMQWRMISSTIDKENTVQLDNLLKKISFTSSTYDSGYILTRDHVYKTTDKGISWNSIKGTYLLHDIDMVNDLVGFVSSPDALFKTSDGGESWSRYNYQINPPLLNFKALSDQIIIGTNHLNIYKSVDGGLTFEIMKKPQGVVRDICIPSPNIGFAIGDRGEILKYQK
ncbi:photosystem II stability/assembly factor-like uncharacterized protein [Natronoflexus pectinivorans]|uniref:Photosystem II stability/assembly factor-like uncharacterized protein n=2 Tax=Natronoflexus pectinivorans TaxID=682526 RepID=A0A4R2GJD7_9BACT|nr:photosystem II stability/assembly factor-like uncharacterized protein [Natronoflexus pectinivorans]